MATERYLLADGRSVGPDQFIDDIDAAALLSLSRSHLRNLRVQGSGAPFAKLGPKSVRYRVGDLIEWASAHRVQSTSQTVGA